LVLTSRFHAMISGLSLCIPTLVIGWSHKYIEALAEVNMEKYVADFARMDSKLEDLAQELLEKEDLIRQELSTGLEKAQKSSLQQFSYLEKFLN
jgi:colanic acid/amylovoran biosynthesis protein